MLTALLAGGLAGLFASAVQHWKVVPLIHAAEVWEDSAAAHGHPGTAHEHADHSAAAAPAHDHAAPPEGVERILKTIAANLLTGIGFGALLTGAVTLTGREPDLKEGILWGMAGFASFTLAPALGLPPEPPGMMAADLLARQQWWAGTAAATAAGIAALAFGRPAWLKAAGVAFLLLPHLIPAPASDGSGAVPPGLAAHFAAASIVASALFWLVLGMAMAGIYRKLK